MTPGNRQALLAAREAAKHPGGLFNPLLVFGPPKSGKSRLLEAFAGDLAAKGLRARVLLVPELGRRFVAAARAGRIGEFTREILGEDALLFDEAERFAGRPRLGATAARIVEAFLARSRPVAAASRIHPRALPGFDARLAALLDGGFSVRIEAGGGAPTLERTAAEAEARFGVGVAELRGPRRSRRVASARGAFVLAALEAGFSAAEVGSFLGGRSGPALARLARVARGRLGGPRLG